MNEQIDKELDRRQFLTRASKAGISIAAAGVASYLLYDADGPEPLSKAAEEQKLLTRR
jgi:hypothetical protein